uniref:Uncharacterized protein n=1 Tax=Arundo donax TaxID=35708 RepID=A0A0A9APD0_ARUDO
MLTYGSIDSVKVNGQLLTKVDLG